MNFYATGDLAQSLTTRRQSAQLQSDLMRLTQELSSGKVADVTRHLNGNLNQISDIENQIALNVARRASGNEASVQASAMQNALEYVHAKLTDVSGTALLINETTGQPALNNAASEARSALDAIVSALNTVAAGRPVFAGAASGKAPLVSSETLMGAACAAVTGANDAGAVIAALDVFFVAPSGGFETDIYQGGTVNLSPFRLGDGETVQLSIRADDATLRSVLKGTVMVALAADDSLSLTGEERLALLRGAAGSMQVQLDKMTQLRADLGHAQERIGQSISRNAAEHTSLQMARSKLLSVDMFETASALEEVQLQLETIYTLTARMSRLNLVNFL